MKPQSKSKTFPKGTEPFDISTWIASQIKTDGTQDDGIDSKYLITIVRYPEKSDIKEEK